MSPLALAAPPTVVAPPAGNDTFTYSRIGKADPFRPFIDLELDKKKREEKVRKKQVQSSALIPLISMPRESFRLVGIAGNKERRVAMVVDPTGKFYPLSPGMVIGEERARIVAIGERSVTLEERVVGGRQTRRVEWVMKSADDEGKP